MSTSQKKLLLEVVIYLSLCYLLIFSKVPIYILHGYLVVFGYILPFWMNGQPKPWTEKIAWLKRQLKTLHIQTFYGVVTGVLIVIAYSGVYYLLIKILAVDASIRLADLQGIQLSNFVRAICQLASIAVCEEIFFRYYLDDRLGSLIHNDIIRLLLAATIFSLAHLGNVVTGGDTAAEIAILVITAIGYPFFQHLVFGFCRTRIKHSTLFSCMVGHFAAGVLGQMVIGVRFDFLMS